MLLAFYSFQGTIQHVYLTKKMQVFVKMSQSTLKFPDQAIFNYKGSLQKDFFVKTSLNLCNNLRVKYQFHWTFLWARFQRFCSQVY